MGYYEAKAERNAALLRMLHGIESEEPPEQPEDKVDFDGGVREPAPPATDPLRDHNLVNLLSEHKGVGVADFWPMAPAKSPPAQEANREGESDDWRKAGT